MCRSRDGSGEATGSSGNDKTQVCLVISSLRRGGAERAMTALANWLAVRGYGVTLVTLDRIGNEAYDLHRDVRRIGLDLLRPAGLVVSWANNFRRVVRLRRTLGAVAPDVIVSFIDAMNVLTLGVSPRRLGPVVVAERTDPNEHRVSLAIRILRRALYRRAAAIVVQTEKVRSWAERIVAPERIFIIPNTVARPAQACPVDGAGRTIVSLGRLGREKGHDILLRAFASVAPDHPDWRLDIYGEGLERSALEALVEELGLRGRAHLPGVLTDPSRALSTADLFVLPSRYEGFPNALLEAMACGLAVIAADCPSGPAAIVRNGVDGVLVPPEDPGRLGEEMGRLMGDHGERARLSASAPNVLDRFGVDKVMPLWEDVFDDVIRRTAARREP